MNPFYNNQVNMTYHGPPMMGPGPPMMGPCPPMMGPGPPSMGSFCITCCNCRGQIQDVRYRCNVCPNYDLCHNCKIRGIHSEHPMQENGTFSPPGAPPMFPGPQWGPPGGTSHGPMSIPGYFPGPVPGWPSDATMRPAFNPYGSQPHPQLHRSVTLSSDDGVIHPNVTCNICGGQVRGTRYKCKVCVNYDLCSKCKDQGHHPEHEMLVYSSPAHGNQGHLTHSASFDSTPPGPNPNDAVHPGIRCDGCNMLPLRGTRYKCKTCPNYDLCPGCKQKGTHAHHQMAAFDKPNSVSSVTQLFSNLQVTSSALPPPAVQPQLHSGPPPAVAAPPSIPTQPSSLNNAPAQFGYNGLSSARWKPATAGVAFNRVELDPKDPEYQAVVDNMQKRGGAPWIGKINTISRVENYKQYRVYLSCKEEMERENGINFENERILWHGTAKDVLNNIYRDGFNRSYCGKNATAYGDGVYFAKDFQYSAHSTYSPPDSNGFKYIFQCRVLTGQFTAGSQGLKEPPMRNHELRYDSIVDKVQSPTMFVIFKDMQAYPEYIISLKC